MKANRARDTGPELRLRGALRRLGVRGYRIAPSQVPGRPDLAFGRARLAVFVHGCFWHQHGCRQTSHLPKTNIEYWALKFRLNKVRDARKAAALEGCGWTVMTTWECELTKSAESVALAIRASVNSRTPPRSVVGWRPPSKGVPAA